MYAFSAVTPWTLTGELGPYNSVKSFRSVHFVVHSSHSPVRFQHTVGSLDVFSMPVFPPVINDPRDGVVDGISVIVLHLQTTWFSLESLVSRGGLRVSPLVTSASNWSSGKPRGYGRFELWDAEGLCSVVVISSVSFTCTEEDLQVL
jgi:hypothetical protein